jgi:hypothetical protein
MHNYCIVATELWTFYMTLNTQPLTMSKVEIFFYFYAILSNYQRHHIINIKPVGYLFLGHLMQFSRYASVFYNIPEAASLARIWDLLQGAVYPPSVTNTLDWYSQSLPHYLFCFGLHNLGTYNLILPCRLITISLVQSCRFIICFGLLMTPIYDSNHSRFWKGGGGRETLVGFCPLPHTFVCTKKIFYILWSDESSKNV